jgi:hypothetical protein
MDWQSAGKFYHDHQSTDEDTRCFADEREKREAGIAALRAEQCQREPWRSGC